MKIIGICLFAWVPLVLLSYLGDPGVTNSYVWLAQDWPVHIRLLFALPVMLGLEGLYLRRINQMIDETYNILNESGKHKLKTFTSRGQKLLQSRVVFVIALIATYALIYFSRVQPGAHAGNSWIYTSEGGLSLAGWWFYLVSLPIFILVITRWALRWGAWSLILIKMSTISLQIVPEHADRVGGLEYLGFVPVTFSMVFALVGAIISAYIGTEIVSTDVTLKAFALEIGLFVLVGLILLYGPLLILIPKLTDTRIQVLAQYGQLIRDHHVEFRNKWFENKREEDILGSADPSSKADIDGSYTPIKEMQAAPIRKESLMASVMLLLAPFIPLVFLNHSIKEVVERILQVLAG